MELQLPATRPLPLEQPAREPNIVHKPALWLELLALFALLSVLSWTGIELTRHSQGVATIWLTNGLLFAIVIRRPRERWLAYFAVGLAADIAADVVWGDPFWLALGVSVANSVEVILSTVLLTRIFGEPFNLLERRSLLGFLGIAVTFATAVTSALGALWTMLFVDAGPWINLFRTWYLGDILGMALIAPLAFVLQRPGFFVSLSPRRLPGSLLILSTPALVTFFVFSDNSDSLLFLIFPALLYVVFRLGLPGAVLALAVIAVISISMTVSGHGPLVLNPVRPMLHGIVIVQIFIAIALFTCFPVAALLEERTALALSLMKSENEYRILAKTDPLTNQLNRRAFDEDLREAWHRAAREQQPFTLLCLDIDSFKSYNDLYGHIAGDHCLHNIALIVQETLRRNAEGQLYRLGGEEFAILLPNQESGMAFSLAERIRLAICEACITHTASPHGHQTISIGLASTIPVPAGDPLSLLSLADDALYRAKANGRNRCEMA